MAHAKAHHNNLASMAPHMSAPVLFSIIIHGVVVIMSVIGLPYLKPEMPQMAVPISVEIIGIDQVKKSEKPPETAKKRVAPKQVHKPPEIVPVKPKVAPKTPPKPVAPQRPDPADTVALPNEEVPKKAEAKSLKKPINPPKPLRRPVLTQDKSEEPVEQEFNSVLRNLMDEKPVQQSDAKKAGEKPSPIAPFAQRMTMMEQSALQAQLSQCWKLLSGARYAEDLIVKIRLTMNPDRTIRAAKIVDQVRYMSDSYFKAAADGALRAVYNPACNPLDLPPEKYSLWKDIVITFDPRQML